MSDFRIEWTNLAPYVARLNTAPTVIREELTRSVDRLTIEGEGLSKRAVPVKTGHLRRSIAHEPARAGAGGVVGRWGTNVPYARYVEFGRGPVVARRGGVLRFEIGGRVLYRPRVGPAAARPFMRPSFQAIRGKAAAELRACMGRVARRLGGGR